MYRKNLEEKKLRMERLRRALESSGGSAKRAAQATGYSESTLQRAKKELGMVRQ